jgi:hypothetical protein
MAISVNSRIVKAFFTLTTNVDYVRLRGNLRIQILPTIRELGGALRYQFAAFIAEDCSLIVWDDDPAKIIARAVDIEQQLVEISYHNITGKYPPNDKRRKSIMPSTTDLEAANAEPRPRVFINCIMMAFTLTLVLATMGLSWMELTEQSLVDHNFRRFALVAMMPIEIFLCLVMTLNQPHVKLLIETSAVFHADSSRMPFRADWSSKPTTIKFEVLFRNTATSALQYR